MATRDDIELMQHFDGELAGELGELSAEERAKLQSLEQMSDVVRSHLELAADDVDARLDGMWSTIERRISANGASHEPAAVERATPARVAREPEAGLFTAIGRWLDRYRSQVLTGAVCAAAAAALVILLRDPEVVEKTTYVDRTQEPTPAPVQVPKQVPVVAEPAVVESLDVEDGSATILTVPGEEGENPVKVIWVTRDDMEPI